MTSSIRMATKQTAAYSKAAIYIQIATAANVKAAAAEGSKWGSASRLRCRLRAAGMSAALAVKDPLSRPL